MTAPATTNDIQYDAYGNPIKAQPKVATPLGLATGNQTAGNTTQYANVIPQTPGGAGSYLGQTITPGPAVDRMALAQKAWDTSTAQSAPAYQASLSQAKQQAAGVGQLGSGMLRTQLGNLALVRQRDMDSERQRLMNDAITGSIADQYQNVGIAQQQQQFQAAQQTTDFEQKLAAQQAQLQQQLGMGNLGVSQQQANTQQLGTTGNLALGQAQLAQQGSQFGQSLTLDQQKQALDDKVRSGQLTIEQANQQLEQARLAQQGSQFSLTLAQQKSMQEAGFSQESLQAGLNRGLQTSMQQAGFTQEQAQAALDRAQQASLQASSQGAEASQAALNRSLQQSMQTAGFSQETAQAVLNRAVETAGQQLQKDLQEKANTQQTAMQKAQLDADKLANLSGAEKLALAKAELSGTIDGNKTFAAQTEADRLKLAQADQSGVLAGGGKTLAAQQAANQNTLGIADLSGRVFDPLTGKAEQTVESRAAQAQADMNEKNLWAQLAQILGFSGVGSLNKTADTTPTVTGTNPVAGTQRTNTDGTVEYADGKGGWSSVNPVTCPAPEIPIEMADGTLRAAGELAVGDRVRVWDEQAQAFGEDVVSATSPSTNLRMWVVLDNSQCGRFAANHRILGEDGAWVELQAMSPGLRLHGGVTVVGTIPDGVGPVVQLTVENTHTYVALGVVSHNVKVPGGNLQTDPTVAQSVYDALKAQYDAKNTAYSTLQGTSNANNLTLAGIQSSLPPDLKQSVVDGTMTLAQANAAYATRYGALSTGAGDAGLTLASVQSSLPPDLQQQVTNKTMTLAQANAAFAQRYGTLNTSNTALQGQYGTLQGSNAALQGQYNTLQNTSGAQGLSLAGAQSLLPANLQQQVTAGTLTLAQANEQFMTNAYPPDIKAAVANKTMTLAQAQTAFAQTMTTLKGELDSGKTANQILTEANTNLNQQVQSGIATLDSAREQIAALQEQLRMLGAGGLV